MTPHSDLTSSGESKRPHVHSFYGENVFNDALMREKLPKSIYKSLKKSIDHGKPLDLSVAEVVATAMKDWAITKGATHFTHWFQPMTGITAEKHDAFISPTPDGKVIMEFSGKELIMGEPDASSFPSGGLRVTFEARGYTAWDCTSPAFFRDNTLYIPTAFYSYTGEVLDKKTPLLRSMEAVSSAALRIVRAFGNQTASRVITTVGAEQEYFLISKEMYEQREDLVFTGRTLLGAAPPKGQELEDHYFGTIKEKVSAFMAELDEELWKLGVSSKTKHNEVAPSQHELAPIFTSSNVATDHNQLVMDTLKKVAIRHGLVCLLHEKPFDGVNGSGKHNNWSMATNEGENLLEPGETPHKNFRFLVVLSAIIKAVDKHAGLLRAAAANPGNDHRLGANEAPPAIISIFMGDQLGKILDKIEQSGGVKDSGAKGLIKNLTSVLPSLPKDTTDRNRTSPFAFTGNKFEFRMVPSSASIAGPNFVLNTVVAEVLDELADRLEKASDVEAEAYVITQEVMKNHKRVIFNGNNYSDEWVKEAEKRGLPNLRSTVDAMSTLIDENTIAVMEKYKVLNKKELHSRYEILLESYAKTIRIEALTMLSMAKTRIVPAVIDYTGSIASSLSAIQATGVKVDTSTHEELLNKVTDLLKTLHDHIGALQILVDNEDDSDTLKYAQFYRDQVIPEMNSLREAADRLELLTDSDLWPIPTYGEILYNL